MHDVGKSICWEHHGYVGATLIRRFVPKSCYELVMHHQELRDSLDEARTRFATRRSYDAAVRFAVEWDHASFQNSYRARPFEYFEALLIEFVA